MDFSVEVLPNHWLATQYPDASDATARQDYVERHFLGEIPDDLADFPKFHAARREQLRGRIVQLLGQV